MRLPLDHSKAAQSGQSEFSANLRTLCSYYRSVADVCRKLNLNRAQFNRYLNGSSKPSSHTIERICDFFGVEPEEIYLPHEEFHRIVQARPKQKKARTVYSDHIERLQHESEGKFEKYLGYYYEYYYSMSTLGRVLRGLVRLFEQDGSVYYERLERFPPRLQADLSETYKCKYVGAAFYLNDRIFLVDYESLTANEICQTILFPTYRNKVTRLTGLVVGVASNNQRSIACARIVFEFLGTHIDTRDAVRHTGLFDPREKDIDPAILKLIDNSVQIDQHHFYPVPL